MRFPPFSEFGPRPPPFADFGSSEIEHIWQMAWRLGFYRGGAVFMSAISGIDIALWDLKGELLSLVRPLYHGSCLPYQSIASGLSFPTNSSSPSLGVVSLILSSASFFSLSLRRCCLLMSAYALSQGDHVSSVLLSFSPSVK